MFFGDDQLEHVFYDQKLGQYYPLQIVTKSKMYNILDNSREHLVDIMEFMYGVDTVHFDDQ